MTSIDEIRRTLTVQQKNIFDQVWNHYVQTGNPCPIRNLHHSLGGADLNQIMAGVNKSLIFESIENGSIRCYKITLLGSLMTGHGNYLFGLLVNLLKMVKDIYITDPNIREFKSDYANDKLSLGVPMVKQHLFRLMTLGFPPRMPIFISGWGGDGSWGAQITDDVMSLSTTTDIPGYLNGLLLSWFGMNQTPSGEFSSTFVDEPVFSRKRSSRSERSDKSVEYITTFLKWLAPKAKVQVVSKYVFQVDIDDDRTDVKFNREEIDDFETAFEDDKSNNYFSTMENRVKFQFYIALGGKGLIPNLKISNEFLQEKGDWLKSINVYLEIDQDFGMVLNEGLILLSASLGNTLASGEKLPEVNAEKEAVDNLIRYYKEKGNLTSTGAQVENISFLKAAAVCVIMKREQARKEAKVPRIRKAIDKGIYQIVERLRAYPYVDIRLPEAIHDYAIQQSEIGNAETLAHTNEMASDVDQSKIDSLLDQLDSRLSRRRIGAWETYNSANPDRLSQSANSMVELLDRVIGLKIKNVDLDTYLKTKYGAHQDADWVLAQRKWIGKTKEILHKTKHEINDQSDQLTKALLISTEIIISIILE